MADDVLRPLLIVACFAAFFGIMTVMAAPLLSEPSEYQEQELPGFSASYLATNRIWFDAGTPGNFSVNVTSDMIGDEFTAYRDSVPLIGDNEVKGIYTNADRMTFSNNDSSEDVDLYIILDNENYDLNGEEPWERYHNFIVVARDYFNLMAHRYRVDIIPLDTILANPAYNKVSEEFNVDMDYAATVHLIADEGYGTVKQTLQERGNFSVMVTDSRLDDQSAGGAWSSVVKLLTFQFTGNTWFDYMIGFPLWVAMIYVSLRIILAFIPFVSGL